MFFKNNKKKIPTDVLKHMTVEMFLLVTVEKCMPTKVKRCKTSGWCGILKLSIKRLT